MGIIFEEVTHAYYSGNQQSRYGLDAVNLQLQEGALTVILGTSGSGKSTLLQHLNGLLLPSAGTVRVLDYILEPGISGKGMAPLRRRVGLVFQFPEQQLFEETVEKDICFGPLNYGMSREDARRAAGDAVAALGLDASILGKNPFQLSGGQMRKAAIATVLAADPDVLVLDEPTATLDQTSRAELLLLLHRLCREQQKTVVLVTHRLEEALPYADDCVVMEEGKVIFQGKPGELVNRADLLETAGVAVPSSVRFLQQFSARFGVPYSGESLQPEQIAEFVKSVYTR